MTDFPDRNLDVLHARVASGMPNAASSDRQLGALLRVVEKNLDGGTVTFSKNADGSMCDVALDIDKTQRHGAGPTFADALEDLLAKGPVD